MPTEDAEELTDTVVRLPSELTLRSVAPAWLALPLKSRTMLWFAPLA